MQELRKNKFINRKNSKQFVKGTSQSKKIGPKGVPKRMTELDVAGKASVKGDGQLGAVTFERHQSMRLTYIWTKIQVICALITRILNK